MRGLRVSALLSGFVSATDEVTIAARAAVTADRHDTTGTTRQARQTGSGMTLCALDQCFDLDTRVAYDSRYKSGL